MKNKPQKPWTITQLRNFLAFLNPPETDEKKPRVPQGPKIRNHEEA
jgi:hypothetical protein